MAGTEFFAALAQVTAAAIGFIIAFTASLYALWWGRTKEREQIIKEEILQISKQFGDTIDDIADSVSDVADFDDTRPKEENKEDWINEQTDETAAEFWMMLSNISDDMDRIPRLEDRSELVLEANQLGKAISEARELMLDRSDELFREIKDCDPGDDFKTENIFNQINRLTEYLTGQTGASSRWNNQIRGVDRFLEDIDTKYNYIKIRYGINFPHDPKPLVNLLYLSLGVAATGIFIPLLFLLTLPETLESKLTQELTSFAPISTIIFISQITVFALTLGLTYWLYRELKSHLQD